MAIRWSRSSSLKLTAIGTTALLAVACAASASRAAEGAEHPAPSSDAATKSANATITRDDARKAVTGVFKEVETIRGLTFKQAVPVDVIDDAKARSKLTARLKRFVSADKLRADTKAWTLLGLIPAGTDLLASVLDALEEQAGGFYDPESKRFFLLDDMPAAMAPMLAAHELTHALEDQHYDLDRRLNGTLDDDDASFATSAVHEGSAMIVMTLHLGTAMASGELKAEDLETFSRSEAAKAETLRSLPAALQRQFIGPYLLGMTFLLRGDVARIAGGFPKNDVDRAYQNGPVSSEQVMHPEKFWDAAKRDLPKPVRLAEVKETLGPGWKKAGSGILGELLIAVLTGAPALDPSDIAGGQDPSRWTNAAAAGWGGDRWELWTKGDRAALLLATVWDSESDAVEFAAAMQSRTGLTVKQSGTRVGIIAGDVPNATQALDRLAP